MTIELLADTEALKVGMNMEEQGLKFYEEMIKKVESGATRTLLEALAEAEREHFKTFSELHRQLSGEMSTVGWALDEELRQYLGSLIETGVFYQVSDVPDADVKDLSEVEALSVGIQAEKDSILFYREAIEKSQNPRGRQAFERILEEGKKHLVDLNQRLKEVQG